MKIKEAFYSLTHKAHKWSRYLDVYEHYLERFVNTPITLVEVGVQNGGSLELWSKLLHPDSKIIGIDIDPNCAKLNIASNVQVVIGDQGDKAFWDHFKQTTNHVDLFIEDGGHTMQQQILTLECIIKTIKPNGVYICEDTHTSYYNDFEDAGYLNAKSFISYTKRVIDTLYNHHNTNTTPELERLKALYAGVSNISYYDSMVVFDKRITPPMDHIFSK